MGGAGRLNLYGGIGICKALFALGKLYEMVLVGWGRAPLKKNIKKASGVGVVVRVLDTCLYINWGNRY